MAKTVTATVAARHLREILDEVEHRRGVFQVERHGRLVATIGPTGAASHPRVRWKDALARLVSGPAPDPDVDADLKRLKQEVNPMPPDPWVPSSIAPS